MIHTGKLNLDQYGEDSLRFDVFSYFETYGYPIDGITEAYTATNVKQDDPNTGHIVAKIDTLAKPTDQADAIADQIELWVCDCGDYQYNQGVDLAENRITEWGHCKHLESVDKAIGAQADENQEELV